MDLPIVCASLIAHIFIENYFIEELNLVLKSLIFPR